MSELAKLKVELAANIASHQRINADVELYEELFDLFPVGTILELVAAVKAEKACLDALIEHRALGIATWTLVQEQPGLTRRDWRLTKFDVGKVTSFYGATAREAIQAAIQAQAKL